MIVDTYCTRTCDTQMYLSTTVNYERERLSYFDVVTVLAIEHDVGAAEVTMEQGRLGGVQEGQRLADGETLQQATHTAQSKGAHATTQ